MDFAAWCEGESSVGDERVKKLDPSAATATITRVVVEYHPESEDNSKPAGSFFYDYYNVKM